jgi:glutamate-1-semialdehyde aminotransferase
LQPLFAGDYAATMGRVARERLAALREREARRFEEMRPRGMELLAEARANMPNGVPMTWMVSLYGHPPIVVGAGSGAAFEDVDGNTYVDFNLADTSMFAGYGVEAVARAAAERIAAGSQFLMPTEEAAEVASALAERFGLPSWQFTLSATQANTEAIRVARAFTGRSTVIMFDGKYHGHADELLGEVDDTCGSSSTTTSRRSSGSCGKGTWRASLPRRRSRTPA